VQAKRTVNQAASERDLCECDAVILKSIHIHYTLLQLLFATEKPLRREVFYTYKYNLHNY